MKAFRLIGMALVAMCLCMNFASCSNEDVLAPEDPQGEKYVTVGLGCTGEFLEFSDSPMGRAATDELYGIQVYALTENESYSSGYASTPYAYGVYTSLDNVKIRLLQGQKYKFEVGIVIDPYKIYSYSSTNFFGKGLTENTSEFVYSSSEVVHADGYVSSGLVMIHDRYYGELDVYTPTENGTVDIHTKRVAYGVRYETIGLATDETFTVEVSQQGSSSKLYTLEVGSEPLDDIYTFRNIRSAWQGKWNSTTGAYDLNYTSNKTLTISWNKADGTIVPMGTYPVTFKRNVKTTIRIKAEANDLENGIRVFKEDVAMVDDENIYEITGGEVVEVPVIPGN
ncbi:MAG: hypothetical protein IKU64_05910 [Bacteroides sp.]|nr:hypothetical protein [Bacteroides sp.]